MRKCARCGKLINSKVKIYPYCHARCTGGKFLNQAAGRSHYKLFGSIVLIVVILLIGIVSAYFINRNEEGANVQLQKEPAAINSTIEFSAQSATGTEGTEALHTEAVEKRLVSIQSFSSGKLQEKYQFIYNEKGQVQGAEILI